MMEAAGIQKQLILQGQLSDGILILLYLLGQRIFLIILAMELIINI
ncbi:MAG: hypothetical protein U9O97_04410 [Elusimicrobiota bacterium]|nr:hypothetical protein [Elusimicrobiota bacterium]